MNYFYSNDIQENFGTLTGQEASHCFKVLRKKEGDIINVLDGKGGLYKSKIITLSKNELQFEVIETIFHERPQLNIHIAIGPTKNISRIEWLLEKATEVGVSGFTFIQCENAQRNIVKMHRLEKIVQSAAKQSGNFYLPQINEMVDFEHFLKSAEFDQKLMGYCQGKLSSIKSVLNRSSSSLLLIIGPEGDFSPNEIRIAKQNNVELITLGHNRLRTETAALVALIKVKTMFDD